MANVIRLEDPDTRDTFIAQGRDGAAYSSLSTMLFGEDERGVERVIDGGCQRFAVRRTSTTTAGTFLGGGNTNVAPGGGVGVQRDYLRNIIAEVATVASGQRAGLFITQLSDPVFAQGLTGSAITNTATQTFTFGASQTIAANALADRVISFQYTPTGLTPMWFTTRIASHAAVAASTSFPVTLEDTPDAGSAPTSFIIHGVLARRVLAPASAAGTYNIQLGYEAETGGFVTWWGNGIVTADHYGVFAG